MPFQVGDELRRPSLSLSEAVVKNNGKVYWMWRSKEHYGNRKSLKIISKGKDRCVDIIPLLISVPPIPISVLSIHITTN